MIEPRGDETDEEADERLGICCVHNKIADEEEMKGEKKKMDEVNQLLLLVLPLLLLLLLNFGL